MSHKLIPICIRSAEKYEFLLESSDLYDKKQVRVKAILVVVHGCYISYSTYSCDNDIALIKISTELTDPHTICLPKQSAEPSNKKLIHTGWGFTKSIGRMSLDIFKWPKLISFLKITVII